MRIACVRVPHFHAAAHERCEPSLRERPLVVVEGRLPSTRVIDANPAAWDHGIRAGIPYAEAVARCPSSVVRERSSVRVEAARQALLDAAWSVSPRVEDGTIGPSADAVDPSTGLVYVELGGLERLFGDETSIAHRVLRATRAVGLPATVGVAGSRTAARLAAAHATRSTIVPPGEDRAWLAAVPVTALCILPPLVDTLRTWGITTLGELAALPRDGVSGRLGPAGLDAHDRARGEDREPFRPYTPPPFWDEAQGVDWEITSWAELSAVLGSVLERLCARLEVVHLAADTLDVRLELASGGHDTRPVSLAAPSTDVKSMLALIGLDLETLPPAAPVVAVSVSAGTVRPEAAQGVLWRLPSPGLRDVAATLARLTVLVGREAVGSPRLEDSHRRDAFRMEGFSSDPGVTLATSPLSSTAPLGFRRLRPPRPIDVESADDGAPMRLTLRDQAGGVSTLEIAVSAGPWRLSGDWWDVGGWARDEWDAVLTDGMLCRLVHDRLAKAWYIDGAYD